MKLAIGSSSHWKDWIITDTLTPAEIDVLLTKSGWTIVDVENDMIFNYVYQRWEPILNKEVLANRIKEDLKALSGF